MEIIVTIAYFFLVRLIFFDYKLIKFNLFWKFVVFGIYAGAALTEIIALASSHLIPRNCWLNRGCCRLRRNSAAS